MSTPTKLRSALEEAKQHLVHHVAEKQSDAANGEAKKPVEPHGAKARSKLNTLRGVRTVEQRPLSVFQRVGVPQRPTYDLIAERVLGSNLSEHRTFLDEGSSYADHVAKRLQHLQDRLRFPLEEEQATGRPSAYVGVEDDGRPVWSQVLDEQRGRITHPLAPSPKSPVIEPRSPPRSPSSGTWPSRLVWSSNRTFKQWFVGEENFEATRCCEAVVDSPASRFNPLHIDAAPQSGCSLLLHATGQAWLRRSEGHVLHLSAADLQEVDPLKASWSESLSGATGLVVDDLHAFGSHADWRHQLGVLLDHALNLGVQVVVGGQGSVQDLPPSRLKEVLSACTSVRMEVPSVPTLLGFARWRCSQKNLLMSDVHLAQLAKMEPGGWAGVDSRLEQVSFALDQGAVLLDHDDLASVLVGGAGREADPLESQRVEDLAANLVGEVLDSVYSSVEPGGIDLHAQVEAWPDDDYVVPEWKTEVMASEGTVEFDRRLRETVESVTPGRPSVLDVHERERYLISNQESLNVADVERAVDVLLDLDETIDQRMDLSEHRAHASTTELARLEEAMVVLAQRAVEADIDELITIADDLRAIEERLVELDPDRQPLPPMEDEASPMRKPRRSVGRRRKNPESVTEKAATGQDDASESSSTSLDSYEPDGEWDIDGTDISPEDLLDEAPTPQRVRLARLHPRKVLVGEEE